MKLKHPASDQTIEVEDDRAATYESQGWEQVGKKSTSTSND